MQNDMRNRWGLLPATVAVTAAPISRRISLQRWGIVHNAGLRLPERIVDDPRWIQKQPFIFYNDIFAAAELAVIRINSHSEYWEGHGGMARLIAAQYHQDRNWSTSSEHHVALHELLHVAQYLHSPRQWNKLDSKQFTTAESTLIGFHVSKYAIVDPIEFLAEVGVGVLLNRIYPPDIMEIYHSLGGIPL